MRSRAEAAELSRAGRGTHTLGLAGDTGRSGSWLWGQWSLMQKLVEVVVVGALGLRGASRAGAKQLPIWALATPPGGEGRMEGTW